MNQPASEWLVLIRPEVAGFQPTRDSKHGELLLDEAPEAYKDIRIVMRGQSDLVKIVRELTPLVSVKGR